MIGWKKALLQAATFGAAFGMVYGIVAGVWRWYVTSPSAWNSGAIRATFKEITLTSSLPNQQLPREHFSYILENTTDLDYSLDPSTVLVMAVLPGGKGLDPDHGLTVGSSDIPAKQKVVVSISRDMDFRGEQNDSEKLSAAMNRQLKQLDGFVLFDKAHHYKIILPKGWPEM